MHSTTALRPVLAGWASRLSRVRAAVLLFELFSGLAVTFGPFHPAVEWGLILHTMAGVLAVAPLGWYVVRHWDDYAASRPQLTTAVGPLETALHLNSEETGTLILLGQVELALGNLAAAQSRFVQACQANPRAGAAWFLRGYIAWKRHDGRESATMLAGARSTRGGDWKPTGTLLEGDVRSRMHSDSGFLNPFEQQWNGDTDPARAFARLDAFLRGF